MGPQPRLDMSERNAERIRRQGSAERARRIALDDEQCRPVKQVVGEPSRHCAGIGARIVLPAAAQANGVELGEAMFAEVEIGMLASKDQAGRDSSAGKRLGKGSKLDRFGTGANDQPYVGKTQSSP